MLYINSGENVYCENWGIRAALYSRLLTANCNSGRGIESVFCFYYSRWSFFVDVPLTFFLSSRPHNTRLATIAHVFKKNLNASKPSEHPPQVEECLKV